MPLAFEAYSCRPRTFPDHEGALPNRQSHLTSPEQAIAHLKVIASGGDLDTIKRAVNAVTRAFAQDFSDENRRARKLR
jgi:hypothetical protein